MSDESYEAFFSEFGAYLSKEKERKKINNDYNPLLVIRSQSDEVRLHSRIIHSLLDTRGSHYQGSLFLEPFLAELGFADFFMDLNKVFVKAEWKHIDLYISDDDKHIIIENKIYAGDGNRQIERYIDELITRQGVECKDIAVVYLSIDEKEVAPHSLGEWKIVQGNLVCGDKKICYKNATYSNEILSWIESCQSKVKNITNLYTTLEFYKKCVEKITKGEKMGLEKFLEQKDNADYVKIAAEIQRLRLEEISVKSFKKSVANKAEYSDWQIFEEKDIHCDEDSTKRTFAYGNKKYLNQTFKFMLTLEATKSNKGMGFRLFVNAKSYNDFVSLNGDITEEIKEIVAKHGFRLNRWGWWLLDEKDSYMVDLTNESLEEYFENLYKKVDALNELLKNDSEIAKLASEV